MKIVYVIVIITFGTVSSASGQVISTTQDPDINEKIQDAWEVFRKFFKALENSKDMFFSTVDSIASATTEIDKVAAKMDRPIESLENSTEVLFSIENSTAEQPKIDEATTEMGTSIMAEITTVSDYDAEIDSVTIPIDLTTDHQELTTENFINSNFYPTISTMETIASTKRSTIGDVEPSITEFIIDSKLCPTLTMEPALKESTTEYQELTTKVNPVTYNALQHSSKMEIRTTTIEPTTSDPELIEIESTTQIITYPISEMKTSILEKQSTVNDSSSENITNAEPTIGNQKLSVNMASEQNYQELTSISPITKNFILDSCVQPTLHPESRKSSTSFKESTTDDQQLVTKMSTTKNYQQLTPIIPVTGTFYPTASLNSATTILESVTADQELPTKIPTLTYKEKPISTMDTLKQGLELVEIMATLYPTLPFKNSVTSSESASGNQEFKTKVSTLINKDEIASTMPTVKNCTNNICMNPPLYSTSPLESATTSLDLNQKFTTKMHTTINNEESTSTMHTTKMDQELTQITPTLYQSSTSENSIASSELARELATKVSTAKDDEQLTLIMLTTTTFHPTPSLNNATTPLDPFTADQEVPTKFPTLTNNKEPISTMPTIKKDQEIPEIMTAFYPTSPLENSINSSKSASDNQEFRTKVSTMINIDEKTSTTPIAKNCANYICIDPTLYPSSPLEIGINSLDLNQKLTTKVPTAINNEEPTSTIPTTKTDQKLKHITPTLNPTLRSKNSIISSELAKELATKVSTAKDYEQVTLTMPTTVAFYPKPSLNSATTTLESVTADQQLPTKITAIKNKKEMTPTMPTIKNYQKLTQIMPITLKDQELLPVMPATTTTTLYPISSLKIASISEEAKDAQEITTSIKSTKNNPGLISKISTNKNDKKLTQIMPKILIDKEQITEMPSEKNCTWDYPAHSAEEQCTVTMNRGEPFIDWRILFIAHKPSTCTICCRRKGCEAEGQKCMIIDAHHLC